MRTLAFLVSILLLASCNKSSEPTNPLEPLVNHAWVTSKRLINTVEQPISICDKDDTLTFGTTGVSTIDHGIEKCFVGQPKFTTRTYLANGNELSVTQNYVVTVFTIQQLNKEILNIYELKGLDTYRYIYTAKK